MTICGAIQKRSYVQFTKLIRKGSKAATTIAIAKLEENNFPILKLLRILGVPIIFSLTDTIHDRILRIEKSYRISNLNKETK